MKNAGLSFLFLALIATGGPSAAFAQMTVVNGASYDSTQPMAPGSFASIFGQNLCGQTAAGDWIAPGQLPTSLGSCSVMVNGTAAMLQYVSPGQINFVVPEAAAGKANIMVMNGAQSQSGFMTVGPAGPGVFSMNGMGVGQGAMLNGMMWSAGPFSAMTNGQPTPVSIFMTGLDTSSKPTVSMGGMPADVTWYGNAPGYVGLQQINVTMPAAAAGSGHAPVTVRSDGQTSNVTFMTVLPTTAMMQGMPGWASGMTMQDNAARAHEMSFMALSPANNTALVTDENDDAVRVIALDSGNTSATITLPQGSEAHEIAVNGGGTLAAASLSAKGSVALIDLARNEVVAVIPTGNYPSHLTFAGANLLVANAGSGTVSVIDTAARAVAATVTAGFGPTGISANNSVAVITNLQGGTLSVVKLADYSVTSIPLPQGTRPYGVAVSGNQAVVTTPMSGGVLIVDLGTRAVTPLDTGLANAMGAGAVAVNGTLAYIANQMSASVTVVDLTAQKVTRTFAVDPGPRALAVNPARNQLVVLAEGTGTLDIVDLASYTVSARYDAGATERQGNWVLPSITSLSPNSAAAGSSFSLAISGSNFQNVTGLEFDLMGMQSGTGMGGGMMGGGPGSGMGVDTNFKVSNVQVNSAGTQITASVQIQGSAAAGTRIVRLTTDHGDVMMSGAQFAVTK